MANKSIEEEPERGYRTRVRILQQDCEAQSTQIDDLVSSNDLLRQQNAELEALITDGGNVIASQWAKIAELEADNKQVNMAHSELVVQYNCLALDKLEQADKITELQFDAEEMFARGEKIDELEAKLRLIKDLVGVV